MRPILAPKEVPENDQRDPANSSSTGLSQYASKNLRKVEKQRVACVACQKAKAKCDGCRPRCARCIHKRFATCTYRERLHVRDQLEILRSENAALRKKVAASASPTALGPSSPADSKHASDPDISRTTSFDSDSSSPCGMVDSETSPDPAFTNIETIPVHLSFPLHVIPYNAEQDLLPDLSMSYTSFKALALTMLNKGDPLRAVLGPVNVAVDTLVHGRQPDDRRHTVCTWACDIARSFERIDFYYRLVIAFHLARFLRWAIVPTAENFNLVPPLMRPTVLQRQVPHMPCIDLVLLPVFRDSLIRQMREFTAPAQMAGLDVKWPYGIREAIDRDPETGELTISERFTEHISHIKNFKFGRILLEHFPEVETYVDWSEDDVIEPVVPGLASLELGD